MTDDDEVRSLLSEIRDLQRQQVETYSPRAREPAGSRSGCRREAVAGPDSTSPRSAWSSPSRW